MADQKNVTAGDPLQRQVVCLRGELSRALARRGTGSEHDSWVLSTATHGQVLLKRLGGNPFELGDAPAKPGSKVEVEGYLVNQEMRYTLLRVL